MKSVESGPRHRCPETSFDTVEKALIDRSYSQDVTGRCVAWHGQDQAISPALL